MQNSMGYNANLEFLEQKFNYFHILQSAYGHINIFKCIEVLSVGDVFQNFPNFGLRKEAAITVAKHGDFVLI